nr:MAG TPA: putative tail fiber protein [Caudoviricetes sp.]
MAQSTTNLGKIHVFPSETLYNQFKDIIADNDLALLKDDGAYIVAALLEQNGYVKFSNGLILQWGYSKSCTVKFHLPFPSQVFFCGIVLDTSYGYEFGPDQLAPKDLNPSGFTKYRDTFPNFWWFAIGK